MIYVNDYQDYVNNLINLSKDDIDKYLADEIHFDEEVFFCDPNEPPSGDYIFIFINTKTLEIYSKENPIINAEDINYVASIAISFRDIDRIDTIKNYAYKSIDEFANNYTKNIILNKNNFDFIYGALSKKEQMDNIMRFVYIVRPSIFKELFLSFQEDKIAAEAQLNEKLGHYAIEVVDDELIFLE